MNKLILLSSAIGSNNVIFHGFRSKSIPLDVVRKCRKGDSSLGLSGRTSVKGRIP